MSEQVTELSQYLTFILNNEEYGVNILQVQEIRGWESATSIPNSPDYMLGVINLRGSVVPVIDMRKKFNLPGNTFDATTVVVIVKVNLDKPTERTVGLVVDSVSDVYNVNDSEISESPELGNIVSTEYIIGLATIEEKMIILLDIDLLINAGVLEDAGVSI